MRASLIVISKCWLKTKTPALYFWEKGTTFNPKLRFAVFHSIAFSTKPYIIGLPSKTMFQPDNSDTQIIFLSRRHIFQLGKVVILIEFFCLLSICFALLIQIALYHCFSACFCFSGKRMRTFSVHYFDKVFTTFLFRYSLSVCISDIHEIFGKDFGTFCLRNKTFSATDCDNSCFMVYIIVI